MLYMKKCILLISLLCVSAVTIAQNGYSFTVNVGLGVVQNENYPALSLFNDSQDNYTSFYRSLQLGMRNSKQFFGVQAGYNILNTSYVALGEQVTNIDVAFLYRRYFPVSERIEVPVGVYLGPRFTSNRFNYMGDEESRDRTALLLGVEAGIMYRLSTDLHIGLKYVYGLQYLYLNTVDDLPIGLQVNNSKSFLDEQCLMFELGFSL